MSRRPAPQGLVSFPIENIITPGKVLTQVFTIEPMRGMHQKVGELGEIELQLLFIPCQKVVIDDLPLESPPLEAMLAYAKERAIPADLLTMMREAAVILVGRTIEELKAADGDEPEDVENGWRARLLTRLQTEVSCCPYACGGRPSARAGTAVAGALVTASAASAAPTCSTVRSAA